MTPTYCCHCAGVLAPRIVEGRPRQVCTACGQTTWLDPKVAACAIPVLDGRIVLIRRGIEPSRGLWTFPGGYLDRGETVEEAAVRETREEVGLDIALDGLVGVYSFHDSIVVVVVYSAQVTGGELAALTEVQEARLFDPRELPWDELAFTSTRQALETWLARAATATAL